MKKSRVFGHFLFRLKTKLAIFFRRILCKLQIRVLELLVVVLVVVVVVVVAARQETKL